MDNDDQSINSFCSAEARCRNRTSMDRTAHGRRTLRAKFGASVLADSSKYLYDLDGKGKLNAIEQTMMKYDTNRDGVFSNDEVLEIIKAQFDVENKKRRMRSTIIGMSCFLMGLALSNLGTSFAAMFLSKELVADSDMGVMRVRGTGDLAAVQSVAETLDLTPLTSEEYQQRRLIVLKDLELDPHSHSHRRLRDKSNKEDNEIHTNSCLTMVK